LEAAVIADAENERSVLPRAVGTGGSRLPFNQREFLVAVRQWNDTGFLSGYDLEES
jgi:hypothetical protein